MRRDTDLPRITKHTISALTHTVRMENVMVSRTLTNTNLSSNFYCIIEMARNAEKYPQKMVAKINNQMFYALD